jgi:glycosyltransferase involved in cell wall biosynthesis
MMAELLFSVVIPTHNRREMLARCLASLERQRGQAPPFEVIVVDDGSSDGTAEFLNLEQYGFPLKYLRIEHGGPSCARNLGAASAAGNYLALTEDDVVVGEEWLSRAARHLEGTGTEILEGTTIYQHTKKEVRRFEKQRQPSFIPCNLFIKREVFHRIGGYDESFFDARSKLYFREDADLGFRLLAAGHTIILAPDVIVEHPPQFRGLVDCWRHARRYMFDPLLYRKHPLRFRQLIEVKTIFGLEIHRPQHYLALIYGVIILWLCTALAAQKSSAVTVLAIFAFGCSLLFRYKYQGWQAIKLYRVHETAGFTILPLVYLWAIVRGSLKFKTVGALI